MGDLPTHLGSGHNPFSRLYHSQHNILDQEDREPGLLITVKHSLTSRPNAIRRTILHLSLIAITRDTGFFRDNLVVHCSEASPIGPQTRDDMEKRDDRGAVVSKFQPIVRAKKDFTDHLDDSFWGYFLRLERSFKKHSPSEHEEIYDKSLGKFDKSTGKFYSRDAHRDEFPDSDELTSGLYVLCIRRKYLRRSLLKKLEINGADKSFRNFLALWIKEITISFNSLNSLSNLISVCLFL